MIHPAPHSIRIGPRRLNEIAIELTSKCNLQCRMCSVWKGRKDGLPFGNIKDLLAEARGLGARVFVPFGAEIFMRKDTIAILEAACELGFHTIPIVSNGMLVARHIDRLAKIDGLSLGISIDGPEHVHDALRGAGSYRAALVGLDTALAAGIAVSLKGVLMRNTIDSAAHLIELARSKGIPQVSFQPFQPEIAGAGEDHSEWAFPPCDRDRVDDALSALLDTARLAGVQVFTEGLFSKITPYLFDRHRPIPPGGCHLPSRFLMISWRGETFPCFFMRGQSLGNVAKGLRLRDIWHGALQQEMQARGLAGACPGCLASCSDLPSFNASKPQLAAQT